jgi:drug/metabolite transporter (DMT)-like permease
MAPSNNKPIAVSLSLLASVLWAAYFPLVLYFSPDQYGVLLAMPFLFGGLPFFALTLIGSRKAARKSLGLMKTPPVILCAALLVALQLDVIISTKWAGAVPTSLFTLLGDIAAIPIMNFAFFGEGGARLRYPLFGSGVVVAGAGAAIVVLGGSTSHLGLSWDWLMTLPLPFLVGGYFLGVARMTRDEPIDCMVSSVTLLAFLMSLVGGVIVLGTGPFSGPFTTSEYGLLALIGLTTFFVAPWAFFDSSRRLTVVIPAVINATIPIFTTFFVVWLFNWPLTTAIYVGIPLAFVGGALALCEPPSQVSTNTVRN